MGIYEIVNEATQAANTIKIEVSDPYQIDMTQEIPDVQFLVYDEEGAGTLPIGDLTIISSKAKVGKSTFISILEGAVLGQCRNFGLSTKNEQAKILHFDTEQSLANCARCVRRVHKFLGWDFKQNYQNFRFYALRKMQKEERFPYIEQKAFSLNPDLVVIDGGADLIQDFQDNKESDSASKRLLVMAETANCAVIVVIHENKGKDDKGMKGHLGTLLLQDGASIFHLEKKNGKITATETESRNKPFKDISYTLDEYGTPTPTEAEKEYTQDEIKSNNQKILLKAVFDGVQTLKFSEFCKRYQEVTGSASRTASRNLDKALTNGVIHQNLDGSYSLVSTM